MIICVINLSLRFISQFGRFHKNFPIKEETVQVPLPFSRNQPENHSHNLRKALGEVLGLLCAPFTPSIPFTSLSLSPLYPFHLSIPFTSLSLSVSLSLSLSYLSFPLYITPSTFLSLSLLLSLFSLSFSLAYLLDVFVFVLSLTLTKKNTIQSIYLALMISHSSQ